MLSVAFFVLMLNVIMLSVITLNVVAPRLEVHCIKTLPLVILPPFSVNLRK